MNWLQKIRKEKIETKKYHIENNKKMVFQNSKFCMRKFVLFIIKQNGKFYKTNEIKKKKNNGVKFVTKNIFQKCVSPCSVLR